MFEKQHCSIRFSRLKKSIQHFLENNYRFVVLKINGKIICSYQVPYQSEMETKFSTHVLSSVLQEK